MSKVESLDYVQNIGIQETLTTKNSSSNIHILSNGLKYKEFPKILRDLTLKEVNEFQEVLLKQTEIKSTKILLPRIVIADNENLYGYITEYANGTSIREIDENISLEKLLNMIKELEEEIMILSEKKVRVYDVHDENIIVNENEMKIIDTDDYYFDTEKKESEILEIKETNLKELFIAIVYSIVPRIQLSKSMKKNEIKYYYTLATQGKIKCSTFIELLLNSIRNKEINDIASLRNNI